MAIYDARQRAYKMMARNARRLSVRRFFYATTALVAAATFVGSSSFAAIDGATFTLGSEEIVSATSDGQPSAFGTDGGVNLSGNGRYVAFMAYNANLIPGTTIQGYQYYVYDRQTRATDLISQYDDGTPFTNGSTTRIIPAISDDGRYVQFQLSSTGSITPGNIYLRDRVAGTTTQISPESASPASLATVNSNPARLMSGDGSVMAFTGADSTSGAGGTYVYDRLSDATTHLAGYFAPQVSRDGKSVYAVTSAGVLYRYDVATGSFSQFLDAGTGFFSFQVSDDADFVLYHVSGVGLRKRDMATGQTILIASGAASVSSISNDGRFISYSRSTRDASTIVVQDTHTGLSITIGGSPTNPRHQLSADGTLLAYAHADNQAYVAQLVSTSPDSEPPVVTGTPDSEPNAAGWYDHDVTINWTATDEGGTATQPAPTTASAEGAGVTYTSQQSCDQSSNCATGSLSLSIDKTAPVVSSAGFATNPKSVAQSTDVLTAQLNDASQGSGVATAEYYDPVRQTWNAMSLSGTTATATIGVSGADYPAAIYSFQVRTTDKAGNVSQPLAVNLDVYDPAGGYSAGHGAISPNGTTSNPGDTLPAKTGVNLRATLDFTVQYDDAASTVPVGSSVFTWGSTCNRPGNDCLRVEADSFQWLIVNAGSFTSTFQGVATVYDNGQTLGTAFPVRVTTFSGGTTNAPSHYLIKVYPQGSDPASASPLYQASGDLTGGQVVLHQ